MNRETNNSSPAYKQQRASVEASEDRIGIHTAVLNIVNTLQKKEKEQQQSSTTRRFRASTKDLYSDFIVREIPQFPPAVTAILNANNDSSSVYPLGAAPLKLTLSTLGGFASAAASKNGRNNSNKNGGEGQEHEDDGGDDDDNAAHQEEEQRKKNEERKATLVAAFSPLIGADRAAAMAVAVVDQHDTTETHIIGPVTEKAHRTAFHALVKQHLSQEFLSSADNGALCLKRATAAGRREEQRRSKANVYLHFTLYKENTETNAAILFVASQCGISARQLHFAGTKDKRAVTLQRVSVKGMDAARMRRVNGAAVSRNGLVRVGDFEERTDADLTLGQLRGNHFTIVLRVIDAEDAAALRRGDYPLNDMAAALRQHGFVNYFGPQRFGTTSVLTSDVGALLLKGDFRGAVEAILLSRTVISPETTAAFEAIRQAQQQDQQDDNNCNGDAPSKDDAADIAPPPCKLPRTEAYKQQQQQATSSSSFSSSPYAAALAAMPHYCFLERDILRYLVANPNNYRGALAAVPRTTAMLYFHAVQSLLWNEWTSRRLQVSSSFSSPLEPMVGDLVLVGADISCVDDADTTTAAEDQQQEEENTTTTKSTAHLPAVALVTAADVAAKRYAMKDVVMTVPGCDPALQYPQISHDAVVVSSSNDASSSSCSSALLNLTKDAMIAEVRARGLGALLDEASELAKMYHFHGTYRRVLQQAPDLTLKMVTYEGASAAVVETDWQLIKKRRSELRAKEETPAAAAAEESGGAVSAPPAEEGTGPASTTGNDNAASPAESATANTYSSSSAWKAPPPTSAHQNTAVVAEFSLPPGAYATSLLREFCVTVRGV